MDNGNNFTKNFREALGAALDRAIDKSVAVPTRNANDPNLNAQNDPLAVISNPSGRVVMRAPQDFDDTVRSFLPELLSNAMAIDRTDAGDKLLVDVDGIINNLKRISGETYNKNYLPGGVNGGGWIRLPYPAGATSKPTTLPKPAGYEAFFERLSASRNGGR